MPSSFQTDFSAVPLRTGYPAEILEKFLLFGGKYHSCRGPPDFRCFPAQQRKSKEEPYMFDRKSDYALNKQDPEAIVCKSVTDIHIRLTRLDFASPEEFERWKRWSDENYHDTERQDHIYHNHILTLDDLTEAILAAVSPEEEVMDKQDRIEREQLYHALRDALENKLTPAQRRRLWLYAVDGLTENEIASKEQIRQQSVSKRINAAKKVLKKFLKRWV